MGRETNIGAALGIGELDERITVRSFTVATNDYGEETLTWGDLATTWAKVEYLNAGNGEEVSSGQPTVFQTIAFTVRYRSDVTEKMRISYRGEEHDILNISEIGRKHFTQIETQRRK